MMSHNVVENVVKQGYLKKGNFGASRLSALFRRGEVNRWFVFTIRQGVPFLEYYDTELDVFTQHPINSFNLSSCQNVKSMGNTNPPSFCIVCPDRVIELVASSRTQMAEWVNEVEASLIRLGILKNEVVDHVYTVCPAVVRKPRTHRDDFDESDRDLLPMAANISESSPVPPPPPRSQLMRQSTIAEKSSLHVSLSRTAMSFHGTSESHSFGTIPPPLPQRLSSQTARTNSHKETDETAPKENLSANNTPEGSNDSDFVSPEVIAELRQQSQASRRAGNFAKLEMVAEAVSILQPDTPTDTDTYIVMNKSYFESSIPENRSSPERDRPNTVAEPSEASRDFNSSTNLENESELTADLSSAVTDCLVSAKDVAENDYSLFPCQQGPSEMVTNTPDVNNSSGPIIGGSIVSKPTPVPRKALPKTNSSSGDFAIEIQPPVSESSSLPVSANCDLVSDDVYVLPNKESVVNEPNSVYEDEYTTLKQPPEESHYNNISCDRDKSGTGQSQQLPVKPEETNPSKDENENFYGLVFNDDPPKTIAPPIPSIPPLPPRQSSLPSRADGCKLTVTQDSKPGLLFPDTTENTYSFLPASAFSAAAPSGKHRSLPSDLSSVPPLPLPRKSGSNYDCLRKSLPASAFTSNGSLDIPPMPPRHTSPHLSQSQEDQPPVLPSRGSQSFFIKRPQLTGLSGNVKTSGDDMFGQKNGSFTSDDHPSSTERKCHETNNSTSKLSKKMLLDRSHSLHTVVSLKQTQAEILQTEISMGSVAVSISQKAGHGIALVDWNNSPCVVGWNQRDFPSLHGKLHLGDLIYSINSVRVTSSETAHKLLKQAVSSTIEILLQRMPHAKVFAIHRNAEGQSLGFKRDGGSGEILYVDPNGLAAQHGLTNYAPSACGSGRCNWFLTEINNRPLNLFFKDNEIDHRLSAVGREISLVVQPSDFIHEIRRHFKKIKNYKNFITQ